MRKEEFLARLRQGLSGLPEKDAEEHVSFYREMIEDRIEDGLTEEEAVLGVGSVEEIVTRIIKDAPKPDRETEQKQPRRRLRTWEIILLILGSPIWLSLGIAAAAVALSVYVTLWSLVVSLWAVFASMVGCALGGIAAGTAVCVGNAFAGTALVAAGILCAGLSIFLFFGCNAATKGMAALTKKSAAWIKNCFRRKEGLS